MDGSVSREAIGIRIVGETGLNIGQAVIAISTGDTLAVADNVAFTTAVHGNSLSRTVPVFILYWTATQRDIDIKAKGFDRIVLAATTFIRTLGMITARQR